MTVITPDMLRSLVLEGLLKPPAYGASPLRAEFLWQEVAEIAQRRGLKYNEQLPAWHDNRGSAVTIHPNLEGQILDIVWDLIIEGVLRPGQGMDGDSTTYPHIHLTEYGKKVVNGQLTPYDPEGFLKRLLAEVPKADPVIIRYVEESAAALRQSCLLSSTVMLGVASEQAFLLLTEAYADALNPADQAAFTTKMGKLRSIKQQHEEFMDWWERKLREQAKKAHDSDWLTGVESSLYFVFGYFRDNRNQAGHPTDKAYSRETCFAHLIIFPTYLRLLYELMGWMSGSKPL